MSSISLPKTVEKAFRKAVDSKASYANLSRHLRDEDVLNTLITHRKTFSDVCEKEYRETLQTLLEFYQPGDAANVNELAKNASKLLDERVQERRISQTAIRDSFLPMLRDIGVIVGDGRLTWAYLDTPSTLDQFIDRGLDMYHAHMAQTPNEAKLKHSLRDAAALRKLEAVVMDSRKLTEDIGNELEFLKREDRKHRELAFELGIPYSQIKDDAMKKRKGSNNLNMKAVAFPIVIALVVAAGFVLSPEQSAVSEDVYAGSAEVYTPSNSRTVSAEAAKYGLSADEYQWRLRYIELLKANNGQFNKAIEDELFDLAAVKMIGRVAMEDIVKTITQQEIAQ